jgi:hypothetical protein
MLFCIPGLHLVAIKRIFCNEKEADTHVTASFSFSFVLLCALVIAFIFCICQKPVLLPLSGRYKALQGVHPCFVSGILIVSPLLDFIKTTFFCQS